MTLQVHYQQARRQVADAEGDGGFALATIIVINTILFLLLAALIMPLTNDTRTLRKARYIVNNRQLAESVLNELFSQATRETAGTVPDSLKIVGKVVPSGSGATARTVDNAGIAAGWAQLDAATGEFKSCTASGSLPTGKITNYFKTAPSSCFYFSVVRDGLVVIAEVTVRSGCNSIGANCVYRRYQQRWKRRDFFNYLVFTDQETLAPNQYSDAATPYRNVQYNGTTVYQVYPAAADIPVGAPATAKSAADNCGAVATGTNAFNQRRRQHVDTATAPDATTERAIYCFDVAYTNKDVLGGRIHTNDRFIWYCGSPRLGATVEIAGSGYPGSTVLAENQRQTSQFGCTASGAPVKTIAADPVSFLQSIPLEMPAGIGAYRRVASHVYTGNTEVRLTNTAGVFTFETRAFGVATWSASLPQPNRGLIYVDGKARVMGNALAGLNHANGLTIMSSGSMALSSGTATLPAPWTGTYETPTAIRGKDLGFIAQGDIVIGNDSTQDVTIQGALLALGDSASKSGTVYVDGWAFRPVTGVPSLHFSGSVISRFRPVFGTYRPATGELITGLAKDLTYPDPPPNPPYYLRPVNSPYERLDLTEVPMHTSGGTTTLQNEGTAAGLTPAPKESMNRNELIDETKCPTISQSTIIPGVPDCLVN